MTLKDKVYKGLFWTSVDKIGVQIIQFILSIFIARILTPEDYGTVALLAIFIAISNVFIDSGFGKALVQDNNPSNVDYSTVFYFNLVISILCYLGMYFSAPFIAEFYSMPILVDLTRVISITLIINSFIIIPNAIFYINLNFKPLAISRAVSAIIGGLVGLIAAYNGYGVWALVYMSLVSSALFAIFQWVQVRWAPSLYFSFQSFKTLFKYGNRLFIGALLDAIVRNLSSIFIGKVFDAKSLGYYSKGVNFSNLASNTIISILYSILFPAFSSIKNDKARLVFNLKKSMRYTALFVFPLFMLGAILAKPLIIILLTKKWLLAATIFQILILARMVSMVVLINIQVLQAIGRSDITLKVNIIKMIISVLFLAFAFKIGIVWIAVAELLGSLLNIFISTYHSGKIFNFGTIKQLKEIASIFISAFIASLIAIAIIFKIENNFLIILIATLSLFTSYITLLLLFKQQDFVDFKIIVINRLKK